MTLTTKKEPAVTAVEGFRRPKTAQQAAHDELRSWLLSGRVKPGDQLVQDLLASELGVSVVPIREALKTMQSEGLLRYEPHRGFFVAELSTDELLELCEIRAALEAMAVRRALPALTDEDVRAMDALAIAMDEAGRADEIVDLIKLDREFHFTVFRAAAMPHLERVITLIWDQSDPYRAMFFSNPQNRAHDKAQHTLILAAVRDRDAGRLTELLDTHRLGPAAHLRAAHTPAAHTPAGARPEPYPDLGRVDRVSQIRSPDAPKTGLGAIPSS